MTNDEKAIAWVDEKVKKSSGLHPRWVDVYDAHLAGQSLGREQAVREAFEAGRETGAFVCGGAMYRYPTFEDFVKSREAGNGQ